MIHDKIIHLDVDRELAWMTDNYVSPAAFGRDFIFFVLGIMNKRRLFSKQWNLLAGRCDTIYAR